MDQPKQEDTRGEGSAEKEEAIRERQSPSGRIVHDAILAEAEEELGRPTSALFWSGVAAGLSMGLSLIAEGLLHVGLPDAGWRPLVSNFGYSLGFLVVILGRQQLFTENTLTPVLPVLMRRDLSTLINMLRLWVVVLAANLLGALAIAWVLVGTSTFGPHERDVFVQLGLTAMEPGMKVTFFRAIFAGWLIALIVWLMPFAETARIWVILLLTYIVGLGHLSHIVAGAVEVFAVAWVGARGWGEVTVEYLLPTLAGNILGGTVLVAALNHAQVVAGRHREQRAS